MNISNNIAIKVGRNEIPNLIVVEIDCIVYDAAYGLQSRFIFQIIKIIMIKTFFTFVTSFKNSSNLAIGINIIK